MVVATVVTVAVAGLAGCDPKAPPREHVRLEGATMGTTWHATVVAAGVNANREAVQAALQGALDRVNRAMSTYDPESEISQFNRAPGGLPVPVSPDTFAVVARALEFAQVSDGAFDPSVLPLVLAWGFGGKDRAHQPGPQEIEEAADLVDYRAISIDADALTLTKARDAAQLDLSAIAKGFGVDQACAALDAGGYSDYLVEVGGEVRARGRNPLGMEWRLGIDRPDPGIERSGAIQAAVRLSNLALATSGDYRNYRVLDGQRVSHTIDPRTGYPIRHALASVSVLAPNCMDADALATCLNVLGPDEGLRLAESLPEVEAYLIVRKPDGTFETRMTSGFQARLIAP
ncbi:MAG: FAD:protein FMN transferase [Planctomycetota bacterium]